MKTTLCLLIAMAGAATGSEVVLKRVAALPLSPSGLTDRLLLFDTDHDGLGEVIHNAGACFQIAEYGPVNRYTLVLRETLIGPWPESIVLSDFRPFDVGDVDRDGRTDMVGHCIYDSGGGWCAPVCIFESRDSWSYPDSLVWHVQTGNTGFSRPSLYADLDGDTLCDIVTSWGSDSTAVFENVADNRQSLVGTAPGTHVASLPVIADFDRNGRTDYVVGHGNWDHVVECTDDNRYTRVCSVYTRFMGAVHDRFVGRDVDHNGKPEYFEVVYRNLGGMRYSQTLCQFEATAEHQYAFDTVDTASSTAQFCGQSLCADVDGDGREEIVWGCGYRVIILKPTGPHQYEKVCDFRHQGVISMCNAADFNGNGYNEIFVGTNRQSFVLEVECIRVLCPDTARYLRAGDTCEIRWQLFQPPRCDSVSLFLWTDTAIYRGERFWRMDTIARGLAPTESSYVWTVPDTQLAWAKVLAIVYGPGWQYDESDTAFSILPAGMAGPRAVAPREWAIAVNPNPARGGFSVRYEVPGSLGTRSELSDNSVMSLGIYDAGGRLVRSLADGDVAPGSYRVRLETGTLPTGIYFVRLASDVGHAAVRVLKVVLAE